jgi:5-hydroxyisourate hydrolase-like protein (transthyretin family)
MYQLTINKFKDMRIIFGGIIVLAIYTMAMSTASQMNINQNSLFQYSYAQVVRTLETTLKIDKAVIQEGQTLKVSVLVRDQQSGQPISGATVQLNLAYAGSSVIRQFMVITDANGRASVSIPIANNATNGQYSITASVAAAGYQGGGGFSLNFGVVSANVDKGYDPHKDYHHNSVFNHHHKAKNDIVR